MNNPLSKKSNFVIPYFASTIAATLIFPLAFLGVTIGLVFVIPNRVIDTTILSIYFIFTCTLYNFFLLVFCTIGKHKDGTDIAHYFSIIVPAHNEEAVIGDTLETILNLDYPSELFEVIVVNDGSKDKTELEIKRVQKKYPHLKLINRSIENGCKGKGMALNTGFADFLLAWRGLEIRPRNRWIIGVFDADAKPEANMLKKVSFQFNDLQVGGVQTLVRIKNRKNSLLAKMQDLEFLAFGRAVQFARTNFQGSVALGGNGQFIRAIALETVSINKFKEYWKKNSLTEDLDITVRLFIKNWENRYVDSTAVHQEGVENFALLLRQRTRWAWGTLHTLRHYVLNLKLLKSNISLRKKIDLSIYLGYILLPFMVLLCYVWTGLSLLGIITVTNFFPFAFCVANSFSFLPLYAYGLLKEKKEYPKWQIIPYVFIAIIYTYHWIPSISSALIKMISSKPIWNKTPRIQQKNNRPSSKQVEYQV